MSEDNGIITGEELKRKVEGLHPRQTLESLSPIMADRLALSFIHPFKRYDDDCLLVGDSLCIPASGQAFQVIGHTETANVQWVKLAPLPSGTGIIGHDECPVFARLAVPWIAPKD